MPGLPSVPAEDRFRTTRWDAVILGGALPGLIAAIRLGMNGARVLVLEEEEAVAAFPGLREPFLVNGAGPGDVLGRCLRALGIPLIDRQRIGPDPLAYQVAFPDARVDVGERQRTREELVTWGFTGDATAEALLRDLAEAAAAERDAMLAAPVVRAPRRLGKGGGRTSAGFLAAPEPARPVRRAARGLPSLVAEAPGRLAALCAAQTRALSNLGATAPPPEAQARLLGLSQEGGTVFDGRDCWLHGLLRRRVEALHGSFRALPRRFRLVAVAHQPGVALEESGEIWCGRALILNAPRAALAAAVEQDPLPDLLRGPAPTRRRLCLHLRTRRSALSEGMAKRVIVVRDADAPMEGTNLVRLRSFHDERGDDRVDLVASSVVGPHEDDLAAREREMVAAVGSLMPFAADTLEVDRAAAPRWDTDAWLSDPPAGGGWPDPCEARLSGRTPTWQLDRAGVAGLGFEGDVLLGWRGGDAVAADLA